MLETMWMPKRDRGMNTTILSRLLVIFMLLSISPGCEKRVEYPPFVPPVQPPPQKLTYDHPVTPQSELSRSAIARRTPALLRDFQKASLTLGSPIFIRIFKESHELEIWVKSSESFQLLKTYSIACFSGTLGPKLRKGDRQAPEGFYTVSPAQMNPNSSFHLAFDIGYPNRYDKTHKRTGNAIMVHGDTVSAGCFAMTDSYIEEIYTIADHALNSGQPFFPVHIFPFRMTPENMKRHGASPHIGFWRSLQPGYELFEMMRRPPMVTVQGRQYAFGNEGKRA